MAVDWRTTLRTLQGQFESLAVRTAGLNHLFVEAANHERQKLAGPEWFGGLGHSKIIDGKLNYGQWDAASGGTMPGVNPSFREPHTNESFDESDSRAIRDRSGIVRAVAVPMKIRMGYFCGRASENGSAFRSLANTAARALVGADDLHENAFATELTELFQRPVGGIRYVFGEVPITPREFGAQGWDAGVLQFDSGILIDMPISAHEPNADNWLLLLHALGWRRIGGSGLYAERWFWSQNVDIAFETITGDKHAVLPAFQDIVEKVSRDSFYSVLGSKDALLDVNLASALAIQLLLAELSTETKPKFDVGQVDYSTEGWNIQSLPSVEAVPFHDAKECNPVVGLLVATDVERESVLKQMLPPTGRRTILQVFSGNNTYFVGRIGLSTIVLCMTAMGSVGRDSSILTTTELIQTWSLRAVVMVGIAFGKDPDKQEVGTVLVSERIIAYESQRVAPTGIVDRGSQPAARPLLLNRFRNCIGWNFVGPNGRKCALQFGPILSGEKLVDDSEFKRQLFHRFPTAIGGEMEGAGVAAAAERVGCEWLVVKAICDWGDGSKTSYHQQFAAAASTDFVRHVLNQPGVLDSLTT